VSMSNSISLYHRSPVTGTIASLDQKTTQGIELASVMFYNVHRCTQTHTCFGFEVDARHYYSVHVQRAQQCHTYRFTSSLTKSLAPTFGNAWPFARVRHVFKQRHRSAF
jgi:hypothetical protein